MATVSTDVIEQNHTYDSHFMSYSQRVSAQSAARVTEVVSRMLNIESVLDVGCAQGTWLRHWQQQGVEDFVGVDGDYVIREKLEIPADRFVPTDVSVPFDLNRRFDLVQCLEVAEHISEDCSEAVIANLTNHSDVVLFSAAPPGQGGEYHVNEQTYDYWRNLFSANGFVGFDAVRPAIADDKKVAVWYRFNTVLYVRKDVVSQLPQSIRDTMIPEDTLVPDLSPSIYRLRKLCVRCLPASTQLWLAKMVARLRG